VTDPPSLHRLPEHSQDVDSTESQNK